jgi:hypothetical protein
VRRERLASDHLHLLHYPVEQKIAEARARTGDDAAGFALAKSEYQAKVKEFGDLCTHWGVKAVSEGAPFDQHVKNLMARFDSLAPPPKLPQRGQPIPNGAIDIEEEQMSLANKGTWSDVVADDQAYNGKAARMPGGHRQWAVQFHIPEKSQAFGKGNWHCYVVARVDAKSKDGAAFTYGIFSQKAGAHVAQATAPASIAGDGEYHAFGFNVGDLEPGMYFWVAPIGDAKAIEAVYVDRFYFVKDEP